MKSAVCFLITAIGFASGLTAQSTGPSTTTAPYLVPNANLAPGSVASVSLLTTGDSIGGYRFPGIPDGMGIFASGGEATVLTTHEIGATQGIVRAHGATGALVSRVTFDPATLQITSARDHNTSSNDVYVYERASATWAPGVRAWDRFCAADLAPASAFQFGGLGTSNRIFLGGEESRPPFAPGHGAAWAHLVTGPSMNQSWELPSLGQCSFENVVASHFPQVKTIVMGLDDSDAQVNPALTTDPSELYCYVGEKRAAGNDIERAGLVGGTLYGLRIRVGGVVVPQESSPFGFGTSSYIGSAQFELVSLGDASTYLGLAQQSASVANDIFRMQRVEDGAWDPRPGFENDFYFVTTASSNSRLWRLRFTAIGQPELGGSIEILVDNSNGVVNLDNLCVDSLGRVLMQEDTGGSSRLAKVWMYDITNGRLVEVAAASPVFFSASGSNFLTTNEESSGITPAFEILGEGWYVASMQNHAVSGDPELVEGGQLLALYVAPDLGREFSFWFSSPAGSTSLALNLRFGTPNGTYFAPITVLPGSFPNGLFFGLDISLADILQQANFGAPFLSTLDGNGGSTSMVFSGLPVGFTLYGVAIDDITSTMPAVSTPISYIIP